MKNIVLLIIDSMNYSYMKKHPELTPFINELKNEGFSFENMFAQAPYTEAAVMNIYCGQNVLDNGGYLKRFKSVKQTIFEAMKDKGYCTYYNSFQPQCFPSTLRRGIDNIYYNVGFDLEALWSYRLYYYSDLLKKNEISENDYYNLIEIFDDNFSEWFHFIESIENGSPETEMISNNSLSFKPGIVNSMLKCEYLKYLKDKTRYINKVLFEKKNHVLFSIPAFIQDNKIKNRLMMKEVQTRYESFFNKIYTTNKEYNLKNCKGVFRGPLHRLKLLAKNPSIERIKDLGKAVLLSKNVYGDIDLFDRINDNYDSFKNAPSFKTHIDHYISWEERRNSTIPSFSCIHVDDIHNPEVFFTYDSDDICLIEKEFKDAEDVMNNLPYGYYGNITHDMSLRYIDSKIKYFFNRLKENGLIDNTIVLICADHGFSFSGNPLRDSFVTNMYLENYNIPCIISGTSFKGKNDKYCSSKDIPCILSNLADSSVSNDSDGKSFLMDSNKSSQCFIEYCGGGCPDLDRRKIKIGCFDNHYFVATEAVLSKRLSTDDISEVYELESDPLQIHNLMKKKRELYKYQHYIDEINKRKMAIIQSNNRIRMKGN